MNCSIIMLLSLCVYIYMPFSLTTKNTTIIKKKEELNTNVYGLVFLYSG